MILNEFPVACLVRLFEFCLCILFSHNLIGSLNHHMPNRNIREPREINIMFSPWFFEFLSPIACGLALPRHPTIHLPTPSCFPFAIASCIKPTTTSANICRDMGGTNT